MRPSIVAGLFFGLVVTAAAANGMKVYEKDPIPESGFADLVELQEWSSKSSFGGGGAEKLEVADQEVYCSRRCVTYGRPTTEMVFWTKKKDRLLPCLIMPVRYAEYRVLLEEQDVVVKCWDETAREFREVMRLKASFFKARP